MGEVRIIAGTWRGKKLRFPDTGVRPTPGRVRETVFNWLGPHVIDARCLDLFAGSGALGLEALSRGAQCTDFVESHAALSQCLKKHLAALSGKGHVHTTHAESFLHTHLSKKYDIIFLDPPYQSQEAAHALQTLHRHLNREGYLYLETPPQWSLEQVPHHWHVTKEKTAGDVVYRLLRFAQEEGEHRDC